MPSLGISQFFSKRWLGNLNLFFNRKKHHCNQRPFSLPKYLRALKVDVVVITGDCTTTSHPKEYAEAQRLIAAFNHEGLSPLLIPGNHDHYTARAARSHRFYTYFPPKNSHILPAFNLKDHGVAVYPLQSKWHLIALDTTLATPLYASNGLFSAQLEKHVRALLAELPSDCSLVMINHFPFLPIGHPRRHLRRGSKLEEILRNDPRIRFYLHGHTHKQSVSDLRSSSLPITLDSGSTSFSRGSWNLLDLPEEGPCTLTPYVGNALSWEPCNCYFFDWEKKNRSNNV